MKKYKTNPKKPKIDPNEIIKDADRVLKFIDDLDDINLETVDIKKLEEEITLIEKDLRKKYKEVLPKNPKDYLDTEK